MSASARPFARRFERAEVGIERSLGVDDEIAFLRHVHDEVWPQHAVLARDPQLLGEIAVLGEPGELDDAPQAQLAPAAAYLGAAQGRREVARLARELRLPAAQGLDLGPERREGLAPLALERKHLRLGAFERGAQRQHQLGDRRLALFQRALCLGLLAPEHLARELQEQLIVGVQRLTCHRVEATAQPRLRLLEEPGAAGLIERTRLQAHPRRGQLDVERLDAARGADVGDEPAQHRAGYQPRGGDREQRGEHAHCVWASRAKCAR